VGKPRVAGVYTNPRLTSPSHGKASPPLAGERRKVKSDMWKFGSKSELVAMMSVFVLSLYSPVSMAGSSAVDVQFTEPVTKVRVGRTVADRTEAARGLAELTRKINSTRLDDR
jgi:hypothetical protein